MKNLLKKSNLIFFILLTLISCKTRNRNISADDINAMALKRGDVVLCGPADKQFGSVAFDISCAESVKADFDLAMALLHSFEYDEAEKVFAKIIDKEPDVQWPTGEWPCAITIRSGLPLPCRNSKREQRLWLLRNPLAGFQKENLTISALLAGIIRIGSRSMIIPAASPLKRQWKQFIGNTRLTRR